VGAHFPLAQGTDITLGADASPEVAIPMIVRDSTARWSTERERTCAERLELHMLNVQQ
jgi:hypothetical protein